MDSNEDVQHRLATFQYDGDIIKKLQTDPRGILEGQLLLPTGQKHNVTVIVKGDDNPSTGPGTLAEGVYQGTLGFGSSLFQGLFGIVAEPVKGAMEGGASGFLWGVGRGITGTVLTPTEGLLDLFSKSAEGYRHSLLVRQETAMKEGIEHQDTTSFSKPDASPPPSPPPTSTSQPKLLDPSQSLLFQPNDIRKIQPHLPPRTAIADWKLTYSSQRDGININTFYRKMEENPGPCIFVIEDTKGHIFGGYLSEPFRKGKGYYGNGESFVFSIKPKFRIYPWSQKNSYYALSNAEFIAMGGGNTGGYAFWLDGDFVAGTSGVSETFENDILGSAAAFQCTLVEAYSFSF